jgi:hypothetical protein
MFERRALTELAEFAAVDPDAEGGWPEDLVDLIMDAAEAKEQPLTVAWWEARGELEAMISALRAVKRIVDANLADEVGEKGRVRLGDHYVRVAREPELTITDPEGLKAWLGDQWDEAISLRNKTTARMIRKTALRELARQRGEVEVYPLGEFFHQERGEPKLVVLPMSLAPEWVREAREGEVR